MQAFSSTDTIFALATGPVRAALAIIRVSGPAAGPALDHLAGGRPPPRQVGLRRIRAGDGTVLDEGLVLWMPGPATATGEDCAELQIHGGRAVVSAVLSALSAVPGCRPAAPGEFTRRAVTHGRLDLTQAEALADLIDSDTERQRRLAQGQFAGRLRRLAESWRADLITASALIEAELDFADEGDVADRAEREPLRSALIRVRNGLSAALRSEDRGRRLREGVSVVILGPVNAGKSTLLNALAGRDVAIVTPFAGTTRDPIEVALDLDGMAVILVDTAGLRDSDDPVEQEGIRRARARADQADILVWLEPAGSLLQGPLPGSAPVIRIVSQIDSAPNFMPAPGWIACSARTGAGMDEVLAALKQTASALLDDAEDAILTRLRHRAQIERALTALDGCLDHLQAGEWLELAAADLRGAIHALDELTGRIGVETVLDAVFSRFCIGK